MLRVRSAAEVVEVMVLLLAMVIAILEWGCGYLLEMRGGVGSAVIGKWNDKVLIGFVWLSHA